MPKSALKVVQDTADPVPTEVLAKDIKAIAEGVRKLRTGPNTLSDRALFLLIQDAAPNKVSLATIADVFTGIDLLERKYVRRS